MNKKCRTNCITLYPRKNFEDIGSSLPSVLSWSHRNQNLREDIKWAPKTLPFSHLSQSFWKNERLDVWHLYFHLTSPSPSPMQGFFTWTNSTHSSLKASPAGPPLARLLKAAVHHWHWDHWNGTTPGVGRKNPSNPHGCFVIMEYSGSEKKLHAK